MTGCNGARALQELGKLLLNLEVAKQETESLYANLLQPLAAAGKAQPNWQWNSPTRVKTPALFSGKSGTAVRKHILSAT